MCQNAFAYVDCHAALAMTVFILYQHALGRWNCSTTALVNAYGFADGAADSLKSCFYFVVVAAATDCVYV